MKTEQPSDGIRHFSKRELVALQFCVALVATRDREKFDLKRNSYRAVMRDAFGLANAFLDCQKRK